ncbi:signal recognition particle receptor beta subunit-domain-containing protein [Chaetomium sp. MPI-CAGE-AT-0009]|nr:signal recognition particle receptor beta subunit-domain-containing protein [Chaetomium sp. MPI-CAGE-AT-0009]
MTALETFKAAFEAALTPSPTVITIGLAIVLFLPILLHFLFSATTPYTTLPSVLLIGPSGAGKTALLTLFERGPLYSPDAPPSADKPSVPTPVSKTHTSQVPSTVELAISTDSKSDTNAADPTSYRTDLDAAGATAKKFLLVDTPGHPKLRGHALSQLSSASPTIKPSAISATSSETHKSKLKALVFVADAAALADADSGALASTAEYLYEVLLALQRRFHGRGGSRAPASVPVLVAANKLDLFTALPAALVKSQLEAELGRIRKARSKGLLSTGDADGDDGGVGGEEGEGWLGGYGSEKFSFKEMMEFDIEVEVIGGNVLGDGPGADKWWSWIGERV